MFGWEGQRVQQLEADLGELLAFGPPHVSLYQLTLEPRTRLGVLAARDLVHCADADRQADLYLAACEVLDRAGLRQYEVSNFARPGFESRHNQAYWERRAYLGLGPSAASLVCERRTRNVASLPRYLEAVSAGRSPVDFVEVLTPEKAALESLWLGLRTSRGVPAEKIDPDHWPMLRQAERDGLLTTGGDGRIALTRKGMAVADGLVLRLLPTAKVDKCACRI
jgi:oxygen-independent coproporphyrinogen-3 oxidase